MKRLFSLVGLFLLLMGGTSGQAQDSDLPLRFAMQLDASRSVVQVLSYSPATQTTQIVWQGSRELSPMLECDQLGADTALIPLADGGVMLIKPDAELVVDLPDDRIEEFFPAYDGSGLAWHLLKTNGQYAVFYLSFEPLYVTEGMLVAVDLTTGDVTPLFDDLMPRLETILFSEDGQFLHYEWLNDVYELNLVSGDVRLLSSDLRSADPVDPYGELWLVSPSTGRTRSYELISFDGNRTPIFEIQPDEPLRLIRAIDGMLVRYDSECGPECRFQVISLDGGNPQTFVKTGIEQDVEVAEPLMVVDAEHLLVRFSYDQGNQIVTEIWLLASDDSGEFIGYGIDPAVFKLADYAGENRFVLVTPSLDRLFSLDYRLWDREIQDYVVDGRLGAVESGLVVTEPEHIVVYEAILSYGIYYRMQDQATFPLVAQERGEYIVWRLPGDQLAYMQWENTDERLAGLYVYNVDQESFTPVIEEPGWIPCVVWSN